MNKIKFIAKLLPLLILFFLFSGTALAADSTSIRLEQPQSPANQQTFDITFVALDTNPSQPVNVQCYKKGPADGSFIAFGSVINLTNGGNTDNCQVDAGIMNQGSGTYSFEAIATGSTSPTSNVVGIDFNNSTNPGKPVNYDKTRPDTCAYKISFRTANDSGKTIKVVLYRSSEATFNVDAGHQVNSMNIGSDTDGSMTNNVSPCDITYYYVLRAFDIYGNGSDVVGDTNVTTTTTTVTGTQQGAIPAAGVLGGATGIGTGAGKEVLGATEGAKVSPEVVKLNAPSWILTHKKISLLILIIVAGIAFSLYRRFQKRVK